MIGKSLSHYRILEKIAVEEMKRRLAFEDAPLFEVVVDKGIGVLDTLKAVCRLVLGEAHKKLFSGKQD